MSQGPVLLTGATGYIGGRLLRRFEDGGRAVRCLVRQPGRLHTTAPTTEIAGDCLDEASLDRALAGVQCAYYLVHSMGRGSKFADVDRRAAATFARAARARRRTPHHLSGRIDRRGLVAISPPEEPRRDWRDPSREPRARDRVSRVGRHRRRKPVVRNDSGARRAVARHDLSALGGHAHSAHRHRRRAGVSRGGARAAGHMEGIFEIGGPEVVSYGGMMRRFASLRGLHRLLLPVPVLTPHLSGLWLALVTPAQARVGRALVEGLKNSTVVRSTAARETFRIAPMPFNAAVVRALDEGAAARLKRDTRTVSSTCRPRRRLHRFDASEARPGGTSAMCSGRREGGWIDGSEAWG